MKLLSSCFSIIIILNILTITIPKNGNAQGAGFSFQIFYDHLSPYGHWIDYPDYGYVWVPIAGPDFFPYASNGYWVFTNYGWTWVSYYSWGWAPFHYGRWSYDDYYGWFWIPDTIWGPAWVVWRTCPGYYGWAPLGPNIYINIVINRGYNPPYDHWIFLPEHYMGRNDINRYYGPRKNNQGFIANSTIINNTYVDNSTQNTYFAGPRREDVKRATGIAVKPVAIEEISTPGQSLENKQLKIYRPVISKSDIYAKPSKIADKKDVKPLSERKVTDQKRHAPVQPRQQTISPQRNPDIVPKKSEPKSNVKTPSQPIPRKEKKQETLKRPD